MDRQRRDLLAAGSPTGCTQGHTRKHPDLRIQCRCVLQREQPNNQQSLHKSARRGSHHEPHASPKKSRDIQESYHMGMSLARRYSRQKSSTLLPWRAWNSPGRPRVNLHLNLWTNLFGHPTCRIGRSSLGRNCSGYGSRLDSKEVLRLRAGAPENAQERQRNSRQHQQPLLGHISAFWSPHGSRESKNGCEGQKVCDPPPIIFVRDQSD